MRFPKKQKCAKHRETRKRHTKRRKKKRRIPIRIVDVGRRVFESERGRGSAVFLIGHPPAARAMQRFHDRNPIDITAFEAGSRGGLPQAESRDLRMTGGSMWQMGSRASWSRSPLCERLRRGRLTVLTALYSRSDATDLCSSFGNGRPHTVKIENPQRGKLFKKALSKIRAGFPGI